MDDVWTLETADQEFAIDDLTRIIDCAFNFDTPYGIRFTFGNRMKAIKYLRTLWDNESWKSIKEKLQTEGSVWYVWFIDGVNVHLRNLIKEGEIGTQNP